MFLEQDVNGKCCLKNTVLAQPVIGDFNNGFKLKSLKRYGSDYWKSMTTKKESNGYGNPLIAPQ